MATTGAVATPKTTNPTLLAWVSEVTQMLQPAGVRWCDGSQAEYDAMIRLMVDGGTAMWLDPGQASQQHLRAVGSRRRGPRRGPHLHLLPGRRATPAPPTTGPSRKS